MTGKTWRQNLLAAPHTVWCVLFIVAPLCFVLYYAFTDAAGGFTFANFGKIFTDPTFLLTFLRSMGYALASTVICLLIAYPLAYCLCQMKVRHQAMMVMLLMLPMWMNFLVRTYSLTQLLDNNGLINQILSAIGIPRVQFLGSPAAVILGMVYNYLPFMVLPIYTVMSKLDKRVIEASRDLGANPFQTLTRVILPLTLSGIVSGVTMVFVPSISTFYVSKAMSNGKVYLIGDLIETEFLSLLNYNMGSALSLILMILILVSMFVMDRFGDDEEGSVLV